MTRGSSAMLSSPSETQEGASVGLRMVKRRGNESSDGKLGRRSRRKRRKIWRGQQKWK
jgi:hypothetical protein